MLLHGPGLILAEGEMRHSIKRLEHYHKATLDLHLSRGTLQYHYLLTNFRAKRKRLLQ